MQFDYYTLGQRGLTKNKNTPCNEGFILTERSVEVSLKQVGHIKSADDQFNNLNKNFD